MSIIQFSISASLQATWIRNTVIHALRSSTTVSVHDVPSNFVYANPTITKLAVYLSGLLSGKAVDKDAERAAALERMRGLLGKYSAGLERHFPQEAAKGHATANGHAHGNGYAHGNRHANGNGHANGVRPSAPETVLVTGTTGRLGSHLLEQLLRRRDVVKVYALNRESSGSVQQLEKRSRDAFRMWGLDTSLLESGKVSFYAVDFVKAHLGLSEALYDEVRCAVSITR